MMKRLPAIGVMAVLLIGVLTPTSAYADGTYRWKSAQWNGYIDVYQHNSANGKRVIVASYSKSNWQLWRNTKLSDGWYRVRNVHTGRSLDRWNSPTSGAYGNGSAGCPATTWDWWAGTQQKWKNRLVWSNFTNRNYYLWINKKGCGGSKYHGVLGTLQNYSDIYLYTEDDCTEGSWYSRHWCHWKKNGK